MTTIEELRSHIRPILRSSVRGHKEEGSFKIVTRDNKSLSFSKGTVSHYVSARRVLSKKARRINKIISNSELEGILDELLVSLAYLPERQRNEQIEHYIGSMLRKVAIWPMHKYVFFIPIDNIRMPGPITIGDSEILEFNNASFEQLLHSEGIELRPEAKRAYISDLQRTNVSRVYAKVTVNAADNESAKALAIQRADFTISNLRIFVNEPHFVVLGEGTQKTARMILDVDTSGKSIHVLTEVLSGPTHVTSIEPWMTNRMFELGLSELSQMMLKSRNDLTDLEKRILNSVYWLGLSMKDQDRLDKYVKATIALESLLLNKERSKKEPLARRIASILSPADATNRVVLFGKAVELYDIRSSITHSGLDNVEEDDLVDLCGLALATVRTVIKSSNHFQTLRELIATRFPEDMSLRIRS
jgi:hypothetical protein